MAEMRDMQLLEDYVSRDCQEAFATLVQRHINLVYSVAYRHVGDPDKAQDVTQAVFIVLAQKAAGLRRQTILSGWLYQTARLTSTNFLRGEMRRQRREQEALMQSSLNDSPGEAPWEKLAPVLDEALARLGDKERNTIVLHFFEGRSVREVAWALGLKEPAARKRIGRAVDKLRGLIAKRGVVVSASALAGAISANSVQAAPAGWTPVITAAAAAKGAGASLSSLTLAKATLKLMAWLKLKTAAVAGATAILAAGTAVVAVKATLAEPEKPSVQQPQTPADLFKHFVEEPPIITSLFYTEENLQFTQAMHNYVKYQTNAMFLGEGIPETLADFTDLNAFPTIISSFDNILWEKVGNDVHVWTNRGIAAEQLNSLKMSHDSVMHVQMGSILNFGTKWLPPASIRWHGDDFLVRNRDEAVWVEGHLLRDDLGRAAQLKERYGPLGQTSGPSVHTLHINYYYESPSLSLPYLPRRFEEVLADDPGAATVHRVFTIHSITTSPNPLGIEQFVVDSSRLKQVDHILTISNEYMVISTFGDDSPPSVLLDRHASWARPRPSLASQLRGFLQMFSHPQDARDRDQHAIPTRSMHKAYLIATLLLLALGLGLIWFFRHRRRASGQTPHME